MKNKKVFKVILLTLIIISILNTTNIYADDIDEDKSEISEVIEELKDDNISQVSKNITGQPTLNSRRCIVYDRNSKTILYGKNENAKVAMASTTKIMTATIVLENASLNDEVTVSAKAGGTGGSRLGLKKRRQINY